MNKKEYEVKVTLPPFQTEVSRKQVKLDEGISGDIGRIVRVGYNSDYLSCADVGTLLYADFDRAELCIRSFKTDKIVSYDMNSTNSTVISSDELALSFPNYEKLGVKSIVIEHDINYDTSKPTLDKTKAFFSKKINEPITDDDFKEVMFELERAHRFTPSIKTNHI